MTIPQARGLQLTAALAATLILSSCAGASAGPEADAGTGEAATIHVDNEFGSADVPAEPQRALGFYTTDVDILTTLGIKLADEQPIRGDSGYTTFPGYFDQEALKGVTPFANYPEFNYEKVVDANPDFILDSLAYDTEIPQKLNPIAPTYNYNGFDGQDWRVHFKKTAETLDRMEQYQAWTDQYQQHVDELTAKFKAAGVDPVMASVSYVDGKVSVDCYGIICDTFQDLGLRISPLGTAKDGAGTQLSLEQLDKLKDIDEVFTTVGVDGEDTALHTTAQLQNSSVWTSLPFVGNDKIHAYEMEMTYGSPSGQDALLEVIEKALLP